MSLIGALALRFGRVKSHLTQFDQRPLSKAALVVTLFLDVFILSSIFSGLDAHTRQLPSPDSLVPPVCRQVLLEQAWNPTQRIERLAGIVNAYTARPVEVAERPIQLHPLCASYRSLIDHIKHDKALAAAFEHHRKLDRELKALQNDIANLKGAYDTRLLETIAKREQGSAEVSGLQGAVRDKTRSLDDLRRQLSAAEAMIDEAPAVRDLWVRLERQQAEDRDALRAELRTLNFWYPVQKLAMQMVFLLPLLALFYFWNAASLKKGRGVQILVSTHLLVVAFIPVFARLLTTVYDILPKVFLQRLIALLESLNLVGLWYYLVIALAIGGALALVYLFQKRIFSVDRLNERRSAKYQCLSCGKALRAGANFCPFCGYAQVRTCTHCGQRTPACGHFCEACGTRHTDL